VKQHPENNFQTTHDFFCEQLGEKKKKEELQRENETGKIKV
jgi:hypothetical protein